MGQSGTTVWLANTTLYWGKGSYLLAHKWVAQKTLADKAAQNLPDGHGADPSVLFLQW